jgi:hypothetical protein
MGAWGESTPCHPEQSEGLGRGAGPRAYCRPAISFSIASAVRGAPPESSS